MQQESQSHGVWIPMEIWEIEELGWTEKLLLVLILHLDNKDGCFATNEYLAKKLFVSKDRITRMVSSLKKKGYITVDLIYKEGTKAVENRIIKVVDRYRQKCREGIGKNAERVSAKIPRGYRQKYREGIGKNTEDNNIFNNKTNNISNINETTIDSLFSYWVSCGYELTDEVKETIIHWCKELNEMLVLRAITETHRYEPKKELNYLVGILKKWKLEGYQTISDIPTSIGNKELYKEPSPNYKPIKIDCNAGEETEKIPYTPDLGF